MNPRIVGRLDPRLRVERQPIAHRRVAGDQEAALIAQEPGPTLPAGRIARLHRLVAADRQHMADDLVEAFGEDLAQTRALQRVSETRIERVDVARQLALT